MDGMPLSPIVRVTTPSILKRSLRDIGSSSETPTHESVSDDESVFFWGEDEEKEERKWE